MRLTRGTSNDFSEILGKSDEEIQSEIFARLSSRVQANPYGDPAYADAIVLLPKGLRAMAATHWLDVSLTLDDIGWHILNFGMGSSRRSAQRPVNGDNYRECLENRGKIELIWKLTKKA